MDPRFAEMHPAGLDLSLAVLLRRQDVSAEDMALMSQHGIGHIGELVDPNSLPLRRLTGSPNRETVLATVERLKNVVAAEPRLFAQFC